jgi:hypothetical protein
MVSKNQIWKKNIFEVVKRNHPNPSKISDFYAAIEKNVKLDKHDLSPPMANGKPVIGQVNWKRNVRNALQDEKENLNLINIAKGMWALPRELTEYEKIDEENCWSLFSRMARIYYSEKKEIYSERSGLNYLITEITNDFVKIVWSQLRNGSHKFAKINPKHVISSIKKINAAGGKVGVGSLINVISIETTVVELHPELSFSRDYSFIQSRKKDSSSVMGFKIDENIEDLIEVFNPSSVESARSFMTRSIMIRQGQPKFRADLIRAYSGRCAVTGTDAVQALEAAHIIPYAEGGINKINNGLILRSDIHSLFDRGLVGVEPDDYSVIMSDVLINTSYSDYERLRIRLPKEKKDRPDPDALWSHLETHDLLK